MTTDSSKFQIQKSYRNIFRPTVNRLISNPSSFNEKRKGWALTLECKLEDDGGAKANTWHAMTYCLPMPMNLNRREIKTKSRIISISPEEDVEPNRYRSRTQCCCILILKKWGKKVRPKIYVSQCHMVLMKERPFFLLLFVSLLLSRLEFSLSS